MVLVSVTRAQSVTGDWYGVGQVKKAGAHNSYLSEMILRQKGKKVTGELNYYYRSSEIKTKITGTYNPRFRVLELNARPMLNFLAKNENGAECPMEGSFTLKITNSQTTLTGQFNPTYEYRIICPAIDIKFVKTKRASSKSTDEAVGNDEEDTTSLERVTIPAAGIAEPIKRPVSIAKSAETNNGTNIKPKVTNRPDSVNKPVVIVRPPIIHKPIKPEDQATFALKRRSFDVSPVIEVDADSLKVSIYDNGEVDNDTISLFYNRKLVARNQLLTNKPITISLPLDYSINEIAMFAENLGRIPPNTALAIIYAGEQRFELNLTSTFIKNGAIRFKRKMKHFDPKNIN